MNRYYQCSSHSSVANAGLSTKHAPAPVMISSLLTRRWILENGISSSTGRWHSITPALRQHRRICLLACLPDCLLTYLHTFSCAAPSASSVPPRSLSKLLLLRAAFTQAWSNWICPIPDPRQRHRICLMTYLLDSSCRFVRFLSPTSIV